MVYNVWNDPEVEIIEAAINRFVTSIESEDIEEMRLALKRDFPFDMEEFDGIYSRLLRELKIEYRIDVENDEIKSYFNNKLLDRLAVQLCKRWILLKNWLKNNKYKIIILPAVLLVGIFIGGCTSSETRANSQDVLKEQNRTTNLANSDIVVDKKTHVEYLVIDSMDDRGGVSITPRLDTNGKPIIKH